MMKYTNMNIFQLVAMKLTFLDRWRRDSCKLETSEEREINTET